MQIVILKKDSLFIRNSNLTGFLAFFFAKSVILIFIFLKVIEEPKVLLFMRVVSVGIYQIRNSN